MRPFEIALIAFLAFVLLRLLLVQKVNRRNRGWSLLFLLGLVAVQIGLEGPRWQLYGAYGLSGLALLVGVMRLSQKQYYLVRQPQGNNRQTKRIFYFFATILLWLGAFFPLHYFPIFQLPPPTGPHQVGVVALDWGKFTPESGLRAKIWYPRMQEEGQDFAAYAHYSAPQLQYLSLVATHSVPNAPLLQRDEPFGVVVFTHDFQGIAEQNTHLMEELASQGWIVFSLDRPKVSLPNQNHLGPEGERVISSLADFPMDAFQAQQDPETKMNMLKIYWQDQKELQQTLGLWKQDLVWLLDELNRIQEGETSSLFTRRLDLGRIALAGAGIGGTAALEVCEADLRCKATLLLNSQVMGYPLEQVGKPLLAFHGASLSPLYHFLTPKQGPQVFSFEVAGAEHYDFTDLKWAAPKLSYQGYLGPVAAERVQGYLGQYAQAFLSKALLEQANSLMVPGKVPGALLLQGQQILSPPLELPPEGAMP